MRESGKSATVSLSKLRMRQALWGRLKCEAEEQKTTLNAAICDRLERSFLVEGMLRGPEAARIAAVFTVAGMHAAEFHGHPEWRDGRWVQDPECYESAMLALFKDLWRWHPTRERTGHAWLDWLGRARSYVTGLYDPQANHERMTTGDLVPPVSFPDLEAGRADREALP
jgi:hypothetical protein